MELLFAAITIFGAIYAINAAQLMRGVLGLAIFFVGLAALFATLGAWYLAVGQIFLFVGGVVTLFVLAFSFTKTPVLEGKNLLSAIIVFLLVASLALFLPNIERTGATPGLASFAWQFFTQYGFIVNVALLLLFGALMASQYLIEEQDA